MVEFSPSHHAMENEMNKARAQHIAAALRRDQRSTAADDVIALQSKLEAAQQLVQEWRDGGNVHEFAAKMAALIGEAV